MTQNAFLLRHPGKSPHLALTALLVLSAILRISYVWFLPGQDGDRLHSDMGVYDQTGWAMAQANPLPEESFGYHGYHPLSGSTYYYAGYTYFVAAIYWIFGHLPPAVRITQAIIATASVFLVYFLGRQVFNRQAGLWAALGMALHLPQVYYAGLLLTETWFTFLQLLSFTLWLGSWNHAKSSSGPGLAVLSGITAGLACLNRAAFLPGIVIIAAGSWFLYSKSISRSRRFQLISLFVISAILIISPVTVRNFHIHKQFVLVSTNGPSTFYVGHVQHTPYQPDNQISGRNDAEMAAWYRDQSLRYLQDNWTTYLSEIPEYFMHIWLSNDFWPNATTFYQSREMRPGEPSSRVRLVIDDPGGPPFGHFFHFPDLVRYGDVILWGLIGLPLAGISLFFIRHESSTRWMILVLGMVPYCIIPFLAPPFPRYRIPAVPILFVFSGYAIVKLIKLSRIQQNS